MHHGSAGTASAPRLQKKRRRPTTLEPVAVSNQREPSTDVSAAFSSLSPASFGGSTFAALPPSELVFADADHRVLHNAFDLRGFRVTDQWLARLLQRILSRTQPGDRRVRSFALDDVSHVSAGAIQQFLQTCSSADGLQRLHLSRCQNLDARVAAVGVIPTSLLELDVSRCEWVDDQFARTLNRRCPLLAKISLARCRRITDYGVAAFAEPPATSLQTAAPGASSWRLTSLDISGCVKVTDSGVLALLMAMATSGLRLRELHAAGLPLVNGLNLLGLPRFGLNTSLEILTFATLSNLRAATVVSLARVGALANVTELDLSACLMIDDEALEALGGGACPQLERLKLAFCSAITDVGLKQLVRVSANLFPSGKANGVPRWRGTAAVSTANHVRLKRLDLAGCFRLTNDSLVVLASRCLDLEVLVLDGVRRLGVQGVHALVAHCPRLHSLYWSGVLVRGTKKLDLNPDACSASPPLSPTSSGQEELATHGERGDFFSIPQLTAPTIASLSLAPELHTLHIGSTQCDVDALAARLSQFGARLVDLNVTSIATDALCVAIGSFCPRLRSLRLSRSRYFSESSFLRIVDSCPHLELLDLESCEQIRDAALETLGRHCLRLERLNLANDWQVTDRGVEVIGTRCMRLKALNVRHCPEVSLYMLRLMAARNNLLVATADGLALHHPSVVSHLRHESARKVAAIRITRWLKTKTAFGQQYLKSSLDRALACIRHRRRCAIRIQRAIRRALRRIHRDKLMARIKQERDARVAANLTFIRAYCVLSGQLRSFIRAFRAEQQRQVFLRAEMQRVQREQAAVVLQKHFRGLLGRRRAGEVRERRRLEHQRRVEAAVIIQRVYRGFDGRKRAAFHRAQLELAMLTTMETLQSAWRLALHAQRVVRGYLGRIESHRRVQWIEERRALRDKSARCIQRALRAFVARTALHNLIFRSATSVQSLFRGYIGRRLARTIVLARAYSMEPRILMLSTNTIYTRELAMVWKLKRDSATLVAECLQRRYRGAVGRLLFRLSLAAVRQLAFRLNWGARRLQHFFRGIVIVARLARFQAHLHLRRRSLIKIQSVWRMWRGKVTAFAIRLRADRRHKHAALLAVLAPPFSLLNHDRDRRLIDSLSPASSLLLLQLGAVHTLVKFYRRSLALRGWLTPTFIRFLHTSATTIQAAVRGHFGRLFARWYRRQLVAAAKLVQRVWRGKLGKQQWRCLIAERRERKRVQDEEDRAARVAQKRTGQFALEAFDRETRHAIVLQRWCRTLRNRQVFRQVRESRDSMLMLKAREKLGKVLRASTDGVLFQARVWRDCVEQKAELLELEDDAVRALEKEIADLKRECLDVHVATAHAAFDLQFVLKRTSDYEHSRARQMRSSEAVKQRIQPFAKQAKQLTLESAREHAVNRQLQFELQTANAGVQAIHRRLQETLSMEPVLLSADVDALLALLPPDQPDTEWTAD